MLDILSLIENDRRLQLVFTYDAGSTAIFGAGVPEFLGTLRASVVPWRQALQSRFDLVIAASENDDLHLFDAPIVLVPHGIGYQKFYPRSRTVAGMNPARLLRDGRVVPAMVALSHAEQRAHLRDAGPEAAARAVMVGDPCHDRLRAGIHRASAYRAALGAPDHKLVVVASTWGPGSLLGTVPDLPLRLVSELEYDGYRCCAVLHPGITAAHSPWQVDAWLSEARQAGLRVLPPEAGWQAALTAASCVISDFGSLALYAAAVDRPVLLIGDGGETMVPGSPIEALAEQTARLDPDAPLGPQIDLAIHRHSPGDHAAVVKQAVGAAGLSAGLLRPWLYRLMKLPEPATEASFPPHEVPDVEPQEVATFVVGAEEDGPAIRIVRFPSTGRRHDLAGKHLVSHETRATLRQLSGAAIVYCRVEEQDRFPSWSEEILRRWPDAAVAAATVDRNTCLVRTRDGAQYELTMASASLDPLIAASLAYLGRLSPTEVINVGDRPVTIRVR
ncbi:hypothetical protein [Amycolatopsis speibonae]|uniref:Uncharacterized protein n=1 Tax=Amycolatopsis speibonae TaxID=1450224 RepID=A0ABV7NSD3_9PSEU